LVGITGGIGAGKTTVLGVLAELGERTIDADNVVHRLYESDSEIRSALATRWGTDVLEVDGRIDRSAVATKVFADVEERRWLNALVHPRVRAELHAAGGGEQELCFCGVPLLFEVGWEQDMVCTVTVWCDRATQVARLMDRGWSDEEIEARAGAQLDMDEKLRRADYGIVNNSSIEILQEQCRRLVAQIRSRLGSA